MKRQSILVLAVFISIAVLGICECAFADLYGASGSIVAWGSNIFGPLDVPSGNDFVAISTGSSCALALRSDGSLATWGDVYRVGSFWVPSGNNYVAIAGGAQRALALKDEGSIVAWDYRGTYHYAPSGNDFVAISGGYWHLALRSDGSLESWGVSNGPDSPSGMPSGSDFFLQYLQVKDMVWQYAQTVRLLGGGITIGDKSMFLWEMTMLL